MQFNKIFTLIFAIAAADTVSAKPGLFFRGLRSKTDFNHGVQFLLGRKWRPTFGRERKRRLTFGRERKQRLTFGHERKQRPNCGRNRRQRKSSQRNPLHSRSDSEDIFIFYRDGTNRSIIRYNLWVTKGSPLSSHVLLNFWLFVPIYLPSLFVVRKSRIWASVKVYDIAGPLRIRCWSDAPLNFIQRFAEIFRALDRSYMRIYSRESIRA